MLVLSDFKDSGRGWAYSLVNNDLPLGSPGNSAFNTEVVGGKQPAQQIAEKRTEIRELISSDLLQEIIFK